MDSTLLRYYFSFYFSQGNLVFLYIFHKTCPNRYGFWCVLYRGTSTCTTHIVFVIVPL